jgi:hypothetical protein
MKTLSNKPFSDWYDNQYGEPSYQETWEAGYAQGLKDLYKTFCPKCHCNLHTTGTTVYQNMEVDYKACENCGERYDFG